MPTRRTIEPKSRLASINTKGKVTPKDAEAYVFAVRTTEARQIIDRYISLVRAGRPACSSPSRTRRSGWRSSGARAGARRSSGAIFGFGQDMARHRSGAHPAQLPLALGEL